MDNNSLKEKLILVTGVTKGMGRDFTEYACEQGATVYGVARSKEILDEMEQTFLGKFYGIEYDLTDTENIETIFDVIKNKDVKLDAFVHCAGIADMKPVRSLRSMDMEYMLRLNFISMVQIAKYFQKKKYSNDGSRIIAISSLAADLHDKGLLSYDASKSALNSAIATMAREFAPRKIRVNAVAPGYVDTEMFREGLELVEGREEQVNQEQYLGAIPPKYITNLIAYLLSEQGDYITGAIIPISGGLF